MHIGFCQISYITSYINITSFMFTCTRSMKSCQKGALPLLLRTKLNSSLTGCQRMYTQLIWWTHGASVLAALQQDAITGFALRLMSRGESGGRGGLTQLSIIKNNKIMKLLPHVMDCTSNRPRGTFIWWTGENIDC